MHVFHFEKTSLNCHLYVFLLLLLLSFTFKSRNRRGLWVELYKTQSLISLKYIAFLWQSNDMLALYTVIQGKMELTALPELTLKWHHSWSNSVVKPITSTMATMNEWIMGSQSEWHAGNEGFYNAYKTEKERALICSWASAWHSQDDDDDDDDVVAAELAFHLDSACILAWLDYSTACRPHWLQEIGL